MGGACVTGSKGSEDSEEKVLKIDRPCGPEGS